MVSPNEAAAHPQEPLFGKYELGCLLGRGTFAKVYMARSITDRSSVVAIKVIDKSSVSDPSAATRVLREVSIMRRLDHPNIIRLHEVMATKSKIYLVMDYARGGDLHSRLACHGPLQEPAARKYFHQLVSALRFCHSHGISHRDIKPQNLLLDSGGNLKISDFGLSSLPENRKDGLLHTACGTPGFAAPELLRGKGYDGEKADAWSCGVILFVLLAGHLPFDDSNLVAMYRKVFKREVVFPPWFSQQSCRLVSRLLDPNPKTRITIDELTQMAWFKKSSAKQQLAPVQSAGMKVESCESCKVNAFDIISMSWGLDLSGLLEEGRGGEGRWRRRFVSEEEVEKVVGRVEEVGVKLGYELRRGRKGGGGVGLVDKEGKVVVCVEVMEVAAAIVLVEMKVFDEKCWKDFADIVVHQEEEEE